MTNYPQPNNRPSHQGTGANPELDPGMRMILSMSPQDGSLKPLPANLVIQEPAPGIIKVTFPDGSVRELIQGGEGAGHMVTTNPDGSRIQSDLTFADGQVSISSISSTGEKTLLSLNENGANIERTTADGQVSNFIPDNASELIQGLREAETYSQAEDSRQAQFQEGNQDFGPWNNYGKPADWQPEQNWQPMGNDGFPRPEYAGNNWVDAGNGSWIAPIQPDAFNHPGGFNQPQDFGPWNNFGKPAEWQPDNNWQPPQNFGGGFNQPGYGMPAAFQPNVANAAAYTQQPQDFGPWNNFGKPAEWQPDNNWQPPQNFGGGFNQPGGFNPPVAFNQPGYGMPAAFQPNVANAAAYTQQPQDFGPWNNFGKPAEWQPDNNWQPPQNFGGGFNQPAAFMPPQNFTSGMLNALASVVPTQHFDRGFNQGYNQPGTSYGLDPQPEPPHTMAGGNWQQEQVANKVMQAVEIMTTDVARSLQMGEAREVQTGGVNFGVTAVNPVDLSATRMFDLQSHQFQPGVMMPPLGNWQPPQNFGGGFNPPATFMPPPMKDASGFPIAEPANDNATGTLFSALQPASAMSSAHILDGPVGDDSPDVTDGEPNTPQY